MKPKPRRRGGLRRRKGGEAAGGAMGGAVRRKRARGRGARNAGRKMKGLRGGY